MRGAGRRAEVKRKREEGFEKKTEENGMRESEVAGEVNKKW